MANSSMHLKGLYQWPRAAYFAVTKFITVVVVLNQRITLVYPHTYRTFTMQQYIPPTKVYVIRLISRSNIQCLTGRLRVK